MEIITIIYTIMFFCGIYFLNLFLLLYFRNKKFLENFPKPKLFPKVSFIVPAYNEEESITDTITALMKIKYPAGKKEIIVVNDGSKDRTAEIVKKLAKKYKELRLLDKQNSGKADSINQALKIVKGDFVAITDADSYPESDALYKMIGYFEEDEKVAAVTSRVLAKNKKNFIEKYQAVDYIVIAWSRKILDFIGCVYVTNGPLSIYRMSALKEVGGFDSKNLTEDIEVTWHLLSAGYKTKMSYSATVYTTVPKKFMQWVNQRVRWNLGGLQTIFKYRKFTFKKNNQNLFGFFIVPYVTLAFFMAFLGLILLIRYLWLKISFYISLIPAIFTGFNPFLITKFNLSLNLLIILGLSFFVLGYFYYSISLRKTEFKKGELKSILVYILIYRTFYILPFILTLYRIAKRDLRWYTK